MTKKLLLNAIIKFSIGIILVGILIFLPAGTLTFKNGWILMGVLFVPILIMGIVLAVKNPELLKKRLDSKEKAKEQDIVVKLGGLMFLVGFIVGGLNYRFGWFALPFTVSIIGAVLFLCGYLLYAEVMRENTYLSRTVEIQENQRVIDSGLYSVIRHPMYSATILLFFSIPLILGSLYSLLAFLIYPILIVIRINGEEKLLEKELEGYKEYKEKVKYRLIP